MQLTKCMINEQQLPQKLTTMTITSTATNNMAQGIVLPLYKGMALSHASSVQFWSPDLKEDVK